MAITPLLSRVEEILAGSNVTPMSRIEVLLVELINYIETGLSSVFHYRGSVQAYSDLNSITNPEVGDVYNVIADGMDYAWTGEAWDSLGTLVIVASEITPDGQAPVTSQAIYNALATKVDKTDQQRQEAEIGVIANAGAKNLFKNTASSSTNVTVNSDGTVIVDTAGEELTANLSKTIGSFLGVSGEKYILSGCPSGGSSSTWRITLSGVAYDYGDGFEFTADGQAHDVIVWVKSGQTVSDLVFKPMIRSASITDSTFVPYAPTNRELYEMILAMQNGVNS